MLRGFGIPKLTWGEDIPAEVMEHLKKGGMAILHDSNDKPDFFVLWSTMLGIMEQEIDA